MRFGRIFTAILAACFFLVFPGGCVFMGLADYSGMTFDSGAVPVAEDLPDSQGGLFDDGPVELPVTIAKLDSPNMYLITVTISEIGGDGSAVSALEDGKSYEFTFSGAAGAIADPAATPYVMLYNVATGESVVVTVAADGSFEVSITAEAEQDIVLTAVTATDLNSAQGSPPLIYRADSSGTGTFTTTNTSFLMTDQNLVVDGSGNTYFSTLAEDDTYTLWRRNLDGTLQDPLVEGIGEPITLITVLSPDYITYMTADGSFYTVLNEGAAAPQLKSRFLYQSASDEIDADDEWIERLVGSFDVSGVEDIDSEYQLLPVSANKLLTRQPEEDSSGSVGMFIDVIEVDVDGGDESIPFHVVSKADYDEAWAAVGGNKIVYVLVSEHDDPSFSLYTVGFDDERKASAWEGRKLLEDGIMIDVVSMSASLNGGVVFAGTNPSGEMEIFVWNGEFGLKRLINFAEAGVNYEAYPKISPQGEFVLACDQSVEPAQFVVHRTGAGLPSGMGDPEGVFYPLTSDMGWSPCPVRDAYIDEHYVIHFYHTFESADGSTKSSQMVALNAKQHYLLKDYILSESVDGWDSTTPGYAPASGQGEQDDAEDPGIGETLPIGGSPVSPIDGGTASPASGGTASSGAGDAVSSGSGNSLPLDDGGTVSTGNETPDTVGSQPPAGHPDLLSYHVSVSGTVAGTVVTFAGRIKNQGDGAAAASQAKFELDLGNNGTWDSVLGTPAVGALLPLSEADVASGAWVAKKGTHRVRLCADLGSDVDESDELNNCVGYQFTITVLPP